MALYAKRDAQGPDALYAALFDLLEFVDPQPTSPRGERAPAPGAAVARAPEALEEDVEERETAFDLAVKEARRMADRCHGFALLFTLMSEQKTGFQYEDLEGIGQIVKDISFKAAECFEFVQQAWCEDFESKRGVRS